MSNEIPPAAAKAIKETVARWKEVEKTIDRTSDWLIHTVKVSFGEAAWGFSADGVSACRSLGGKDVVEGEDVVHVEGGAAATDKAVKAAFRAYVRDELDGYQVDPAGLTVRIFRD